MYDLLFKIGVNGIFDLYFETCVQKPKNLCAYQAKNFPIFLIVYVKLRKVVKFFYCNFSCSFNIV